MAINREKIRSLIDERFPGRGGHRRAATSIGIDSSQLSRYLIGLNEPGIDNLGKIASAFGVTILDLLEPPAGNGRAKRRKARVAK